MPETRPTPPLKIFLSYSHHDQKLCERFLVHLSQLMREGLIAPWSDQQIVAGESWAGAIDENLNAAHVIILLVSPDFLASNYCNDVEMDRALERHQKGEAYVVPLILKPCDWETSRFAGFQALPKGSKPVVKWREEQGYVDAVKALRRLIQKICNPAPLPVRVVETAVQRHPLRWLAGAVLAVALIAGWALWSKSQHYLKQGTDMLNIGRYSQAEPDLLKAKKVFPFNSMAGCGLAAVKLDKLRSDPSQFTQRLSQANRDYPRCAYTKVLSGDQKYLVENDRQGALAEYEEAVRREPRLAEAYFDIGRIKDLEGDPDGAFESYKKAAALSPTPAYHNNLADMYFRRGEYEKAIEEYGQVSNFPLAALVVAKIYRLQNNLDDAAGREEDAKSELQQPSVRQAEESRAWALDVSADRQIRLVLIDEKECYAELELAITRFLHGDESQAAGAISATIGNSGKCRSRQKELREILRWELRRLGSEVPQLTKGCEEFAAKLGVSLN